MNYHSKFLLFVAVFALAGCETTTVKVGLAAHSNALDAPEYYSDNPLGIVRFEDRYKDLHLFFEHESQVFRRERGLGYNKLGALIELETVGNWFIE